MKLAEVPRREVGARLTGAGLSFRTGPFVVRAHSPCAALTREIVRLYGEHRLDDSGFADFPVAVAPPKSLRRWYRPQVLFYFNGSTPFKPLPADQAYPLFEWGLNWCVAMYAHQYLVIHAAVIARDDKALIMPGPPGAGKSTLCAGLVARGWRLLSDELTLVDVASGLIWPLVRPINLKNASIGVIKAFAPEAVFSAEASDTAKGTVALMKPPPASVAAADRPARAVAILLPRYTPDAEPKFMQRSKARACLDLAEQGFNFGVLGEAAFQRVAALVDDCESVSFEYGHLARGVAAVTDFVTHQCANGVA